MIIVQIVPKLPPKINGLGDYALNLARQLRQDFAIETHFIVGDPEWEGAEKIEGFSVSKVSNRSTEKLLSILKEQPFTTVLLHYVGYGYARRGYPLWLINALENWLNGANQSKTLVTMFHETYAYSNKPWHSSFWFSLLQKKLARKLANLSNCCVTNREENTNIISKLTGNRAKKMLTIPVFSNIGEASQSQIRPLQDRKKRIVVFGHRNTRALAYQQYLPNLEKTCQLLKIDEIYDVGVSTGLNISHIKGIPVIEKGVISAVEIQEILLNSLAGFLCHPSPSKLAKSTIFAAYCAHKVIPIMPEFADQSRLKDGLQVGKNYLTAMTVSQEVQGSNSFLEEGLKIAENAYQWYQNHNLSAQTRIFATQLNAVL